MIVRRKHNKKRTGAAIAEMAIVVVLVFWFLFGIFEYCRLLFVLHLTENAARDAARFAAVHTSGGTMSGDPTTISQSDLQNLCKTGQVQGITYGTGLCGMDGNISGLTVNVFTVDPTALAQTTPVVQQLSGSTWNSASFSQNIAVQITGTYQPVLPSFLFLGSSVPFSVTVMCSSEGN